MILEELLKRAAQDIGADDITADYVMPRLADGRLMLERFDHGFALVGPSDPDNGAARPFLLLLWVEPEFRGRGYGKQIVKTVLGKYSTEYHMELRCYGPKRATFFSRLGFKVEERRGDLRTMTTWRAA